MATVVIPRSRCDIIYLSIATGCFPDNWKTAKVAPIFKSGQPDDRSNYRPISVLPVPARVFEKQTYYLNQLATIPPFSLIHSPDILFLLNPLLFYRLFLSHMT